MSGLETVTVVLCVICLALWGVSWLADYAAWRDRTDLDRRRRVARDVEARLRAEGRCTCLFVDVAPCPACAPTHPEGRS